MKGFVGDIEEMTEENSDFAAFSTLRTNAIRFDGAPARRGNRRRDP